MSQSPSSLPRLFAEMKRRKVFRVMAVYGVIGFGVIEAAGEVFPRVGIPDWAITLVVWLALLGFPIAVVLAWAFESSPEGMKRTVDATSEEIDEIIAQPASKRWPAGLLALAGVALLFGGWWMGRQGTGAGDLNLAVPEAHAADFLRVAVLPFEDLGGNDDSPLVTGMHIAVQNKLEGLADLRVIAPSSVRAYEGTDMTTRQIAEELGSIDHVLRGTVGRSGNQAQISARLIDVATNENLWTDEWVREVTPESLFELQSQIARRIADAMQASLSPEEIERLEAGHSTDNPEAINAYYRARNALSFGQGDETWLDALNHAERAVELAPEYVEAWGLVARIRIWGLTAGEARGADALAAVERAETLGPGSPSALRARASYVSSVQRDVPLALELMSEAVRLAPSDAELLASLGFLQSTAGDYEEGLRTVKRAVALDPRNPDRLRGLANLLSRMGMYEAAAEVSRRALAIEPDDQFSKLTVVNNDLALNRDPERARSLSTELGIDRNLVIGASHFARLAMMSRDYDAAAELVADVDYPLAVMAIWRNDQAAWIEELRGGDPTPYRDSVIALVDSMPETVENFKDQAATARFMAGEEEAGLDLLEQYLEEARSTEGWIAGAQSVAAEVYARFGHTEEALAALGEAVAQPSSVGLARLELSPRWDPIRGDPQFEELMARQAAWEEEQARLAEEQGPWLP